MLEALNVWLEASVVFKIRAKFKYDSKLIIGIVVVVVTVTLGVSSSLVNVEMLDVKAIKVVFVDGDVEETVELVLFGILVDVPQLQILDDEVFVDSLFVI